MRDNAIDAIVLTTVSTVNWARRKKMAILAYAFHCWAHKNAQQCQPIPPPIITLSVGHFAVAVRSCLHSPNIQFPRIVIPPWCIRRSHRVSCHSRSSRCCYRASDTPNRWVYCVDRLLAGGVDHAQPYCPLHVINHRFLCGDGRLIERGGWNCSLPWHTMFENSWMEAHLANARGKSTALHRPAWMLVRWYYGWMTWRCRMHRKRHSFNKPESTSPALALERQKGARAIRCVFPKGDENQLMRVRKYSDRPTNCVRLRWRCCMSLFICLTWK